MRLADLSEAHWRPGMLTHRRLNVLLLHLPMDSAYKTWIRDNVPAEVDADAEPDFTGQRWDLMNYQMARLTDVLIALNVEDAKPSPIPAPKPPPRPSQPAGISREQQLEMLAQVRNNRGWG